ncbi:unnamed protein product [Amoebophrya sp. A25]|nr:unnamed protein product [Amoebophrya sp. A25]|eukprot:GSA25T00015750001.1
MSAANGSLDVAQTGTRSPNKVELFPGQDIQYEMDFKFDPNVPKGALRCKPAKSRKDIPKVDTTIFAGHAKGVRNQEFPQSTLTRKEVAAEAKRYSDDLAHEFRALAEHNATESSAMWEYKVEEADLRKVLLSGIDYKFLADVVDQTAQNLREARLLVLAAESPTTGGGKEDSSGGGNASGEGSKKKQWEVDRVVIDLNDCCTPVDVLGAFVARLKEEEVELPEVDFVIRFQSCAMDLANQRYAGGAGGKKSTWWKYTMAQRLTVPNWNGQPRDIVCLSSRPYPRQNLNSTTWQLHRIMIGEKEKQIVTEQTAKEQTTQYVHAFYVRSLRALVYGFVDAAHAGFPVCFDAQLEPEKYSLKPGDNAKQTIINGWIKGAKFLVQAKWNAQNIEEVLTVPVKSVQKFTGIVDGSAPATSISVKRWLNYELLEFPEKIADCVKLNAEFADVHFPEAERDKFCKDLAENILKIRDALDMKEQENDLKAWRVGFAYALWFEDPPQADGAGNGSGGTSPNGRRTIQPVVMTSGKHLVLWNPWPDKDDASSGIEKLNNSRNVELFSKNDAERAGLLVRTKGKGHGKGKGGKGNGKSGKGKGKEGGRSGGF